MSLLTRLQSILSASGKRTPPILRKALLLAPVVPAAALVGRFVVLSVVLRVPLSTPPLTPPVVLLARWWIELSVVHLYRLLAILLRTIWLTRFVEPAAQQWTLSLSRAIFDRWSG